MSRRLACLFLLLCSTSTACSGGSGAACEVDDDCASGFCKANGTCGKAAVDAGDSDAPGDGINAICSPNHDGVIDRAELPMAAGRVGTFRIATDATWSTAGVAMTNGMRRWDLGVQLANDADVEVALAAPAGAWWAATFPGADYTTQLVTESDLRGVFEFEAAKLSLLGVVSPDSGTYKTELEYDPPAQILAVPLQAGATWTTTSTVSGYAQGVFVAYTEKYESRVDLVGSVVTPYGEFPAQRVVTDLTRTSGFTTLATKRSFTWVAECFGPVATAQSQDFETGDEFSDVAEVRRLAP